MGREKGHLAWFYPSPLWLITLLVAHGEADPNGVDNLKPILPIARKVAVGKYRLGARSKADFDLKTCTASTPIAKMQIPAPGP